MEYKSEVAKSRGDPLLKELDVSAGDFAGTPKLPFGGVKGFVGVATLVKTEVYLMPRLRNKEDYRFGGFAAVGSLAAPSLI